MNLKSILSDLPTFGIKQGKSFIKTEKVQEIAKEALKKGIARRSPKRAKEEREYNKERKIYLSENSNCELKVLGVCTHVATTIHHSRGRIGKLLLDKKWWKRGCLECHKWVEEHPEKAKELKLSFNRFTSQ